MKEYQTPWHVNLIGPLSCGGTLISPNVSVFKLNLFHKFIDDLQKIVTAAHCISSIDPKSWKIRAGHLTLDDLIAQTRNIARLYTYPRYNSKNHDGNIAVIVVRSCS